VAASLFTIGHGTRSSADLVAALVASDVSSLVDVRRFPDSRRNPQFAREPLQAAIGAAGIDYRHDARLGGRRRLSSGETRFAVWENASFRAYAVHMTTAEWRDAFAALLVAAVGARVCVMCAETAPWRCHRRLIADAAVAAGCEAFDIMDAGVVRRHVLLPPAGRTDAGELHYAGDVAYRPRDAQPADAPIAGRGG